MEQTIEALPTDAVETIESTAATTETVTTALDASGNTSNVDIELTSSDIEKIVDGAGDQFQLKGSPRWNAAADAATAKGLRPGSHEWMEDIRETIRHQPDLTERKQHPKKDRPQNKREGRPEHVQSKQSRGQKPQQATAQRPARPESQERRPSDPRGDFQPQFANYGAIVSMLLKASRFRRNQHLRQRGEIKSVAEVREYCSVSVGGPRQSGKTKFLVERFQRGWSTSLLIVRTDAHVQKVEEMVKQLLPADTKASQIEELMKRVLTVKDVLDDISKFSAEPSQSKERLKLVVEIDPDIINPSEVLMGRVGEYLELQRQFKSGEPPATHPTLMPLQTVYIDDFEACQTGGLSFQRLVRFLRIGNQTPEIIVVQH